MSSLVLAHSLSDSAALTAGNETSGLPATNLQTKHPSEKTRTSGLSTIYYVVDLSVATEVDLFALLYHNGTNAGTLRVRGATSEANLTAAPSYDSGTFSLHMQTGIDDWTFFHTWLYLGDAAAETLQWWRFDVADGANPDGYFQAGRLIIAKAYESTRGIRLDWNMGIVDPSPRKRAIGGQVYPLIRNPYRMLDFTFDFLEKTEAFEQFLERQRVRGTSKDIMAIVNADDSDEKQWLTIYGLFNELQPLSHRVLNLYQAPFQVMEMI